MVSLKATYWMTVGVLALVLGNSLVNQHADWTRCLADQANQLSARAQTIFDRSETRLASVTASRQARIQTVRIRALENIKAPVVVCPRVSVPADEDTI